VRAKSIRRREPCTQVEFCTTPVLTGYSVYSGKDESSAERWDNGWVQTLACGRAKKALSMASWPDPCRGRGAPTERTAGRRAIPPSLLPHHVPFAVVLHVHALPDFVIESS